MRDIVKYYVAQHGASGPDVLRDSDHPARQIYLERYADRDGSVFLNRFYDVYGATLYLSRRF